MSNYLKWDVYTPTGCCTLVGLNNVGPVKNRYRARPYESISTNAYVTMDDSFPKDKKMADNIRVIGAGFVISGRLKEFLESKQIVNVQYIPITIINHNGNAEDAEYFVLHPHGAIDCIDMENSVFEWCTIDPKTIDYFDEFVINEDKIDPNRLLFRPKYYSEIVLIRKDLAEEIVALGFTGIDFEEAEEIA
ncbi:MAG: hypothetical protein OEZ39_17680 [Gammaproteobacteria bacterium]|nr:hypothetical protein [Gammaproteobacteria bacterium]MDH5653696.1 hypothetical protein [Gammaproteobacteria bacterium]